MIPRVAIHRMEGSFSDRWIEYCAEHGVAHEVVNCYDSGILGRLRRGTLRWFLGPFAAFLRIRHRSRLLGNRSLG